MIENLRFPVPVSIPLLRARLAPAQGRAELKHFTETLFQQTQAQVPFPQLTLSCASPRHRVGKHFQPISFESINME